MALVAYDNPNWRIWISFSFFSWQSLQWQFTIYYLQTASLFTLTLQCNKDADLVRVNQRKTILVIIEWSIQAVFVAWLVYMVAAHQSEQDWNLILCVFQLVAIVCMAMIVFFSARHIHIHSKPLEKLGIKTNNTYMALYVVVWSSMAIFMSIQSGLYISIFYTGWRGSTETARLSIALAVFFMMVMVMSAALELLVIYSYYSLSKRLSIRARQTIASSLRSSLLTSSSQEVSEQDLARTDRDRLLSFEDAERMTMQYREQKLLSTAQHGSVHQSPPKLGSIRIVR